MLLQINMILFLFFWQYKSSVFVKRKKRRRKIQNIQFSLKEKEAEKTSEEIKMVKQPDTATSATEDIRTESEKDKWTNTVEVKCFQSENKKYLALINVEKKGCYGSPVVIKEKEKGELVVRKKEDDYFYVEPTKDILDEAEYKYSALINCFELTRSIVPGNKYRVMNILKQAKLKKTGDEYILEEKGMLGIEKCNN